MFFYAILFLFICHSYYQQVVLFLVYCLLCAIFLRIFQSSYYRSFGHVVSECGISFGNNHFHGELIHLFISTGIIIAILLHYNSLPCGTECCSRMAARPGQRLRKKTFIVGRSLILLSCDLPHLSCPFSLAAAILEYIVKFFCRFLLISHILILILLNVYF